MRDGVASPALRSRVAAAAAQWRSAAAHGSEPYVFCLGGGDGGEPEARVMASLLEQLGVPRCVLIEEARSGTTEENLLHLRAILTDPGFPDAWAGRPFEQAPNPASLAQYSLEGVPVTIVTSSYHLPRALLMARTLGFVPRAVAAHHPTSPRAVLREIGALILWGGRAMRRRLTRG